MSARSHSPFATALLLIPIVSIPLLAIFGVPQLTPTVPSALSDRDDDALTELSDAPSFPPDSSRDWDEPRNVPTASGDLSESAWNDAPLDATSQALAERRAQRKAAQSAPDSPPKSVVPAAFEEPPASRNASVEQASPLEQPPVSGDGGELPTPANGRSRAAIPSARGASAPAAARSLRGAAQPLTWQSAVRRLNELEIRNFRLEPGQQPDQFVFICSYTPQDNPRVSYRFEAEADEPLRAVEKVLAQIDAWLAGR